MHAPDPQEDSAVAPCSFAGLSALLHERHSCRAFLPRPLARDVMEKLIAAAARAPSWSNSQPWHLCVASGDAAARLRRELRERELRAPMDEPDFSFPASYSERAQARRRQCGGALYAALGIARGDLAARQKQQLRNYEFFDAPHIAVLTTPAQQGVYGAVDCGAFLGILLVAAQALGIAAIAQAAPTRYAPVIRELLGLPDDRNVICTIALGYPDEHHPVNAWRTERAPIEELASWSEA